MGITFSRITTSGKSFLECLLIQLEVKRENVELCPSFVQMSPGTNHLVETQEGGCLFPRNILMLPQKIHF